MDLQEDSAVKRKRVIDESYCVICEKSLTKENSKNPVVRNPTKEGLQSILDAADIHKDKVYDLLWPVKDDILALKQKVLFHKNCRANYTSQRNLQSVKRNQEILSSSEKKRKESSLASRRLSRASTSDFNIREQCFICGEREKKTNKLTQITTDKGETTRSKVLAAAEDRMDEEIRMRMLCHPDLFAFDAKYHRNCYSHYISERNIRAARSKNESESNFSVYDLAFKELTVELSNSIFSSRKIVMLLKDLHKRFLELLETGSSSDTFYASWKLKQKLQAYYGDKISFIERPGHTDFVCSISVTVGDALRKASELQTEIKESEESMLADTSLDCEENEENVVLHRAAGILRASMTNIDDMKNEYVGSDGIKVEACRIFVPDILYDFITWCTSSKDYENAVSSSDDDVDKKQPDLKVLSICHGIISHSKMVKTPLQLGLAIKVHHDFGSKKLSELLHSLGHAVSYNEVRQFVTSVANDQLSKTDNVYVPHGIKPVDTDDTCTFVDAAIDNFDLNEDSLDGKRTTHALATVIYQRCGGSEGCDTIPRTKQKSLSVNDYNEETIKRYNKPQKRPEPSSISDVSVLADGDQAVFSKFASKIKDFLWSICRGKHRSNMNIPSWAGFNSLLSTKDIPPNNSQIFSVNSCATIWPLYNLYSINCAS